MKPTIIVACMLLIAAGVWPRDASAADDVFQETLTNLRQEAAARAAEDAERVAQFEQAYRADTGAQQREAAELRSLRSANDLLRVQIESEASHAEELHDRLARQIEELDRLFAILRQRGAELATELAASPVSADDPGRVVVLREIARRENNPDLGDLEQMWRAMLGELVAQGRVVRADAPLITADGRVSISVLRTGVFTTLSDRGLLFWDAAAGAYRLPAHAVHGPRAASGASTGHAEHLLIDTGRGAGLGRLAANPSLRARILAGGYIAVLILGLALLGSGAAVLRWIFLARSASGMRRQAECQREPRDDNPLGRIWLVPQRMQEADAENLALALDEVVSREVSGLRRGEALIRLLAALTPLLGLLGTVTGMIATFESITRFGAGDPVLMADGISKALVTTWLGLGAAIPLVLAHAWLGAYCRTLIEHLEEASTTLIANRSRA